VKRRRGEFDGSDRDRSAKRRERAERGNAAAAAAAAAAVAAGAVRVEREVLMSACEAHATNSSLPPGYVFVPAEDLCTGAQQD
jgi:hypothetical protein